MSRSIRLGLFLLCACCSFWSSIRAQHPILASFVLVQVDNTVQLTFGVLGGASCNGVEWERAGEDLVFETVGAISGVCGGSEFTEYYSLTDEEPIEGELSYYRLVLGSQGRSSRVSFQFIALDDGVKIYPNPAQKEVNVRFSNPSQKNAQLILRNLQGQNVLELSGNSDQWNLDVGILLEGMYILAVLSDDESISFQRRLMVVH